MSWFLFKNFLFSKQSSSLTKTIAWLCISSIGFGVFCLILVISVMNGFGESTEARLLAAEPHLVVWAENDSAENLNNWNKRWQVIEARLLSEKPEVKTYRFEKQDILIKTVDGFYRGVEARGIEIEALEYMLKELSLNSGYGDADHFVLNMLPGEVFVGIDLAKMLGIYEEDELTALSPESLLLPAGEIPRIDTMTVKGFLSTTIAKIDSQSLYYVKGQALGKLEQNQSRKEGVEIRLLDPTDFEEIRDEIQAAGFNIESWRDRNSSLFLALKLEKFMISLLLILGTLIAGFSVITILILLMTQKKKEIGILLAMGMTPQRIRRVFTGIGVLLSGVGGGAGLLFGTLLSMYIEKNPLSILPDVYYDPKVPAKVDYNVIAITAVVALCLSLLTAWFASRKVSGLDLVEVIRQKR